MVKETDFNSRVTWVMSTLKELHFQKAVHVNLIEGNFNQNTH